jgi:hypothetical protein
MTEYNSKSPDVHVNRTLNGQCADILEELQAARGGWVPLPQIMRHAAQYNSRIFSLRKLGYKVENRSEVLGGVRHSYFRLIQDPAKSPIEHPSVLPQSATLFGSPQPKSSMLDHECGRTHGGRQ